MAREYPLEKTRNIGIIAHIDAGKTTVTERILFYTGKKHKIGEVHEGEAEMDWMDQEKERGITITAAATTCFWSPRDNEAEKCRINIIDTPGHIDFTAEVQRSLRVLDGGVVVFDGVAGVEPQSETVYHQAEKFKVPLIAFINKMDRTGADFYSDLASIRERLTKNAYPIQLPIGAESNFLGVVDLLTKTAWYYHDEAGKDYTETEIPEDLKEVSEKYRHELLEAIVAHDENLLNRYLEGKEIDLNDLKKVLRKITISGELTPVLCGSALKNKGVQQLLDAVCDFLPNPLDIPPVKGFQPKNPQVEEIRRPDDNEPFCALAFKIAVDPFVGKLCFFRVYSGTLSAGSYVLNSTSGTKERIGRIVRMHANHREDVKDVYAGEIAAAVGLKDTFTGHTLCAEDRPLVLESIVFPEPVISVAIEPKTKADQEKMSLALSKLAEEDPTFKIRGDEETMQTIISGMGELHLEVLVERMKREFKVEATVGRPQVAYKETIKGKAEAEGKYTRQSGGRGQYGHCRVRVEPRARGEGFEFIDEIKGGIVPREYVPAIQKGVKEAMDKGVVAGYPLIDLTCTVYDGSYHEVDSSEAAFKIAGSMALQEAVKRAMPIILEPIMKVEVITPESSMGDVIGNINSKRGQVEEMRDRGQVKIIDAKVPLAEMFGYATELRSMTQGRASYNMAFDNYSEVPANVVEKIKGEDKRDRKR